MPLPYTTLVENRALLVRTELKLTPASQDCLVQAALSTTQMYNNALQRDNLIDAMYGHFYTNTFGFNRQPVTQIITSNFVEELIVNPGLSFQAFRTISDAQLNGRVSITHKLVLVGSFVTLRVLLYSIVPVLWYLQQDMAMVESQPRTALVTLDNELLTFMNTQLCLSQER